MRSTPYIKLSPNQLHNILLKRKLPSHTIEAIKEDVAKRKAQIRLQRVEDRVRAKRWGELIKPLSKHIFIVQTNQPYHKEYNPELYLFFQDYLDCLQQTRNLLRIHKIKREATPINTDRTKRTWVDWVDGKAKKDLTQRYLNIPYRTKSTHRRKLFPVPKQTTQVKDTSTP